MPKKKSPNSVRIRNSTAEFLTFAYQTGGDGVEVRVQDGTIWLSQKNMGLLFETTPENVLMHLKNIFAEKELAEDSVAKVFLATAAKRRVPMTMEDWAKRLDIFLSADEREVLKDAGRISAEIAREHAEGEFEKYRVIQDRLFQSDFDTFAALENGDE